MQLVSYREFVSNLILEEIHPELREIIDHPTLRNKQRHLANKIKDLSARGQITGIEGNMPKGSSRAYLKNAAAQEIVLDGKKTTIPTGMKVAITAKLDKFHNKGNYEDLPLGNLQNFAENNDPYIDQHRILKRVTEERKPTLFSDEEAPEPTHAYVNNTDVGIFPPLINHDNLHHAWSEVGHVHSIKKSDFPKLTKTKEFPKGVTHEEFFNTLHREYERNIKGNYWEKDLGHEKNLDHVLTHPLVAKFAKYHNDTAEPVGDYIQIQNLGVFHHPDGSKHIVARDHGFTNLTKDAYTKAHRAMIGNLLRR